MKKTILFLILVIFQITVWACPVCERNQPKILRGIVHGSGPENYWDYISIGFTILIAVLALVYAVKWLIQPNEQNPNHIKYSIFK